MTNLQTFFAKAKKIYSAMKENGKRGLLYWNEAQKIASAYFKALKKGTVTFWKLPKNNTVEAEICTRSVVPISTSNYISRGVKKTKEGMLLFFDTAKQSIISFNYFQLMR